MTPVGPGVAGIGVGVPALFWVVPAGPTLPRGPNNCWFNGMLPVPVMFGGVPTAPNGCPWLNGMLPVPVMFGAVLAVLRTRLGGMPGRLPAPRIAVFGFTGLPF